MKHYLSLIKFSHTIFALPFALVGFVIGLSVVQQFDGMKLLYVILCMVFARSAAMAFNRYLDRDIDAKNPRTATREIPAGIVSPSNALFFVVFNAVAFVVVAGLINSLCLILSPVALFVILFYSYSKRFTALCHVILGIGLGLAPIGAFMAVTGSYSWSIVLLGLAVVFWVAGFDIIYALQDDSFDEEHGLHSLPVRLGRNSALRLSSFFHLVSAAALIIAVYHFSTQFSWVGWKSYIAAAVFVASLFYQHSLVSADNLSRVNRAFFTTNGMASLVFGSLVILDYFF